MFISVKKTKASLLNDNVSGGDEMIEPKYIACPDLIINVLKNENYLRVVNKKLEISVIVPKEVLPMLIYFKSPATITGFLENYPNFNKEEIARIVKHHFIIKNVLIIAFVKKQNVNAL